MVRNVFRLDERQIGSMMIPRSDIVWLDTTAPIEQTLIDTRIGTGFGITALEYMRKNGGTSARAAAIDAAPAAALNRSREVLMVFHVAGVNDYLVHVAVRDTDHLRRLVLDAFTARPEVAHLETNLIFSQVRNPKLPLFG